MSEKSSALHLEVLSAVPPHLHEKKDITPLNQGSASDSVTERDVRSAFLDDILTKEQNSCIEIRDICTGISNDAKEALRSGCTRDFIRTLKEQMHTLQAGIESLDDAAGKKNMLEDEFVEKGTSEWLAKRFSSETRRRRLRGHKRRPKQDSDEYEAKKTTDESPPLSKKSPVFQPVSPPSVPPSHYSSYQHSASPAPPPLNLTHAPSSPLLSSSHLTPPIPTAATTTTTTTTQSSPVITSSSSSSSARAQNTKRITSQMNISSIIN
jgi:hypothetical protein